MSEKAEVLLIDDEENIRKLYEALLKKKNINCITVGSAEKAYEVILNEKGIKFIIADYILEKLSDEELKARMNLEELSRGEIRIKTVSEFTRKIRKEMPNIPIVLLTGQRDIQMKKLRSDKILVYDVLLHKNEELVKGKLLSFVTGFLEAESFEIFNYIKYSYEESSGRVKVRVLSKVYPSVMITLSDSGQLNFEGTHFLQDGNLFTVFEHLKEMSIIATKILNFGTDKDISLYMGKKRSTIQNIRTNIDEENLIIEKENE